MLILALLLSAAHAQVPQGAPQPTPEIQAIYTRLLQEVQSGVQCAIREENLQRDLIKTRDELEKLKKDKPK